jgi:dihydroorotate dehydrogenase (NAD+) catalytic subunit
MHTGLANPGLSKVLGKYRMLWRTIPLPIILHLVGDTKDNVSKSASRIDAEDAVDGIELGLHDDIQPKDAAEMVRAAVQRTDKPVLVRLPAQNTFEIAEAAEDSGAGALVACAPPRGTAREPKTGRLVSGRIYSPLVKPMILRIVGLLARRAGIPVIGAGGIHSAQDGRDYLEAGACAIQVDSVTWVQPDILELIARDLGGLVVTREAGAFPDEWHPGMGETERQDRRCNVAKLKVRSRREKPRIHHGHKEPSSVIDG